MLSNRRRFLAQLSSVAATNGLIADERPRVLNPRATDGDERHEPKWDDVFSVTVANRDADLNGSSERVLQAAVDLVAARGGGLVRLLPGKWVLRAAVILRSGVRLAGSGADTLITRGPSETIAVSADSDWYDQEITLEKRGSLRPGDGIALMAKDTATGRQTVIKRTVVARSGTRFKLNDGLRENLWLTSSPTCSTLFPLLTAEYAQDVVIENLTLDGNRSNTDNFNGNYGGCIFLQDCNRFTMRNVEARNYNGDGISFQICHDVVVEDCWSHGNADLGVHPGSGSQRPLIVRNRLEENNLGLFWCWGVKYGLAEDNRMLNNRSYGVSIGHNDTDNVMRNNFVSGSGRVGILFRDDSRGQDFWANRNLVEKNTIVNSGGDDGVAIDVQGHTRDVQLIGNVIREDRGAAQRIGIRLGKDSHRITMTDNQVAGLQNEIVDLRTDSAVRAE